MNTTFDHVALAAATNRGDRLDAADVAAMLRGVPLLATMRGRELRRVARLARIAEFARGDFVIAKGDRSNALHLILSGHAHVMGRRTLGAGDYFGEIALLDDAPRSATVIAGTDLQTAEIPRVAFLRLARSDHAVALALMETLAARVREVERAASPRPAPAAPDVGWPVPGLA